MKSEFAALFLKYVLKSLFAFGILEARFEPGITKKSLNEFVFRFQCCNSFYAVPVFFNIFLLFLKIALIIFSFQSFDFELN